jgi:hypothetical protein
MFEGRCSVNPQIVAAVKHWVWPMNPSAASHEVVGVISPFRFSRLLPERHLHYFAVGRAFRFHHGVAVDVHGGRDLRVPHELLLDSNRSTVSLDRDDPALDSISDQDEPSISAPVVWPALRCAELDCCTGYRPVIGRVVSAEHPNQEKHKHAHKHTYKNILGTGARQPHNGYGVSEDLDARRSRTSIYRARMGDLCCLHPLAHEFAVVWRRWRVFISPRRRRAPGSPRRCFVSCDRVDELGGLSHSYRHVRVCEAPVGLFLDSSVVRFHSSRHGVAFGSGTVHKDFATAVASLWTSMPMYLMFMVGATLGRILYRT